jgi:hypothetical protein
MAQTQAANAATRLHPVEWASGAAAGVAAAIAASTASTTAQLVQECVVGSGLCRVQQHVAKMSPLEW